LERLYAKSTGLKVLAFPSNSFKQEYDSNDDIVKEIHQNMGSADFVHIFDKTNVLGKERHPVFDFLTENLSGWLTNTIKWNYTKFLIGKDGTPLKRLAPHDSPIKFSDDIKKCCLTVTDENNNSADQNKA
ncbi:MAG: hypothetical protein MHPSP_004559, partial [Paramarteilia canceri]